jgi:hypothetical protein
LITAIFYFFGYQWFFDSIYWVYDFLASAYHALGAKLHSFEVWIFQHPTIKTFLLGGLVFLLLLIVVNLGDSHG